LSVRPSAASLDAESFSASGSGCAFRECGSGELGPAIATVYFCCVFPVSLPASYI
jgi:hypothetical protein